MGRQYRELMNNNGVSITTPDMRSVCQRPGNVDGDGNILYVTKQAHKDECDVNNIIKKYDKTGLIIHVSKIEAEYGDMTGIDFKSAQDKIAKAKSMFRALPAEIRKRFKNSASELLDFMDNGDNREEAIKLGLIRADWTPETDGLGEHVREGENVVITGPEEPVVKD